MNPFDTEGFELVNVEAEQCVLGALLTDATAIDRIGTLTPADFHAESHRLVWSAIERMSAAGLPVDVLTVDEALRESGDSERVGGLAFLGQLASTSYMGAMVARHAQIVRERSMLRRLVGAATECVDVAKRIGLSPAQKIDHAQALMMALGDQAKKGHGPRSITEVLISHMERIEQRMTGKVSALSTGLDDVDRALGGGLRGGQLMIVAARPAMGKAQPLDASVLAADGYWLRMGDVRVGQALASIDGLPSVVTGVFPQGEKDVVRVRFTDGRSTECCREHLWRVFHRKWPEPRVMTTDDVAALMQKPSMKGRLWIDECTGDFGHKEALPLDPWLLGALLGDGCLRSRSIMFSKAAEQTLQRLRDCLPESVDLVYSGGCDWRLSCAGNVRGEYNSNPVMRAIRDLGLDGCSSQAKFIPDIYMRASRHARLGIVRGLMDTDGWVEKFGAVRFATSSAQLAHDFQLLVRSLGFWCSTRTKEPRYTYRGEKRDGKTSYVMTISGHGVDELFLFDGKRERCANRSAGKRVAFDRIEFSRRAECQCISVSHPSRLYVTDEYVVTHNTSMAMQIALAFAERGDTALFCSQEMPEADLADRAVCLMGRIPLPSIVSGQMRDHEWAALTAATGRLHEKPLYLDEQPALTLMDVRSKARQVARTAGLKLLVVDYLQLMSGQGDNRNAEIEAISRGLKQLAKEMDIPVIALSQLNRGVEARANKRPMASDLRDSGAIEQDADIIAFIYRDEVYNPDSPDKGMAEFIIGKQRQGASGQTVRLTFIGEYTRFESFTGVYEPRESRPVRARRGFAE